jgi:broad specificity phosphatase PhoE
VGLAAVYTSPLTRSRATADAIANRCATKVRVMPALTDLDYGRWQGLTEAEASARDPYEYETFRTEPLAAAAPGGESLAAVKRCVLRCVEQIVTRHPTDPVAAVTHEVPLRLVVAATRGSFKSFWEDDISTGAIFVLTIPADGKWSIDHWARPR